MQWPQASPKSEMFLNPGSIPHIFPFAGSFRCYSGPFKKNKNSGSILNPKHLYLPFNILNLSCIQLPLIDTNNWNLHFSPWQKRYKWKMYYTLKWASNHPCFCFSPHKVHFNRNKPSKNWSILDNNVRSKWPLTNMACMGPEAHHRRCVSLKILHCEEICGH